MKDSKPKAPIIYLTQTDKEPDTETFAKAVAAGLNSDPKTLPSMYFYDAAGSKLFQEIMDLPEYYLTRSEFEILSDQKKEITQAFSSGQFFHLIDLGAGDGKKTRILINQLKNDQVDFEFVPVDISADALVQLNTALKSQHPDLKLQAVAGEYFSALNWMNEHKTGPKVLLFLGSNIGNFEKEEGLNFLKEIRKFLNSGDKLFMGCDLKKDPRKIRPAYDDAAGVTAAFNFNLLRRINNELGADFEIDAFEHFAEYDPIEGAMKSYLISKKDQKVNIPKSNLQVDFKAWEAIHTENSYKYSVHQIEKMAEQCGFKVEKIFTDKAGNFADVLMKTA